MRIIRKKTYFKNILLSYIIVLLVPMLVSLLFAWNSTVTVAEKSRRIARMTLESRSAALDATINELYSIAGTVAANENVQFCVSGKHSEREFADAGGRAAQALRNAGMLNDTIADICVYGLWDGRVITFSGRYQRDLSERVLTSMGFGGVDMGKYISSNLKKPAVILSGGEMYVMRPLLVDIRVSGAVFIRISDTALQSILNLNNNLSGTMCIVSDDGNVYPKNAVIPSETENEKSFLFFNRDGTMMLSSALNPFVYYVTIPSRSYLDDVDRIVRFIVIYNLFALAAGGILAYIYARRNYSPIKRLLKSVGSGDASLDAMLRDIEERFKKYRTYDAEHKERMRSRLLFGILHGDGGVDARILSNFGIKESSRLAVIAAAYTDTTGILFHDCELTAYEQQNMAGVIIRSITEELLSELGSCCMAVSEGEIACIISASDWEGTGAVLERASEIIEENFGLLVTYGASRLRSNGRELPAAYREALEALDYAIFEGNARYVLMEDIDTGDPQFGDSSFSREYRQFLNALIERSYAAAADSLSRMQNGLSRWTVGDIRRRGMLIAGAASEFIKYKTAEDNVWHTRKVKSLFRELTAALNQLQAREDEQPRSELARRAKKLIDGHYTEYSLDISRICDIIGVSQSHLSREFKRETGMTLTDYIGQQRLQEAKRLLSSSDLSIKEISQRIGYPDPRALTHLFRQTEGLTAAEYRVYIRSLQAAE